MKTKIRFDNFQACFVFALIILLSEILFSVKASAQLTVPSAFDLSSGNYTLNSYSATSFPANIAIGLSSTGTGNFTTSVTADASNNGSNIAGWFGEGSAGISLLGNTSGRKGSFLFRGDATGRSFVTVAWTSKTILNQANTNYIELQWSIDAGATWNNVTGDGPYAGNAAATSYSVTLPAATDNVSDLRIRWIYYEDNTGGARDRLAIDDITISSSAINSSSATDYFRSKQTGNWSNFSSWQSSPNGSTWYAATLSPTNSAQSIEIQNNHTITLTAAATAKLLTIDAGGVLTYNANGGYNLAITDDGTTAFDFTVNGRYEIYGTQPTYPGGGTAVVNSGGEVRAMDNTNGQSDGFAQSTSVYFKTGSLFSWYITQNFNTNNVIYFPNALSTDKATILLRANITTAGANAPTTINGKIEIASGYSATLQNKGVKIFRDGVGGGGTLVHNSSCGPFQITSSTAVIDGTITIQLQNDVVNSTGNALEIKSGAVVTTSGNPTITVGTGSSDITTLYVAGTLNNNTSALDMRYGKLVVDGGTISGSGLIKTGILTDVTIAKASSTTSTATIYPDATYNYLHDLNIGANGTLTLGAALNISGGTAFGTLTVKKTLNANGYLTLKSDAGGDAQVANSSGVINGNVTVERYIPARRAWRFLSVPVSSTQSINAAWQEGATPNPDVYTLNNPVSSYGTQITYTYNGGSNGYDANTTSNPSIKYWNPAINAWASPSSTYTLINSYDAYCLFVRGSRAVNLALGVSAISDVTVLRTTGTLKMGNSTQSFSGLASNTPVLIGNPYASPVNLISSNITYTGVNSNYFYVWDPKIGGTFGVGRYVTYTVGSGWNITGGSYSSTTLPVLQSGQAFFMRTSASGGSVTFKENSKATTEFNVNGRMRAPQPVLFAQLLLPADSMQISDGVSAVFGTKYSKDADEYDAPKLWNFEGENMALVRGENTFAAEARPKPESNDTLFFRLYLRQQPYTLKFFAQSISDNVAGKAQLIDKYLNTETEVNLFDTTFYNFTPNTDTNSYRNRFMLVFNRANYNPVTSKQSNKISVVSGNMKVFPNPVIKQSFSIQLSNLQAGKYRILVYDAKGNAVLSKTISHAGRNSSYKIILPSGVPGGVYKLVLNNNKNILQTTSLIKAD